MSRCDVAILGAGPYGLAAAAHLSSIRGLDVRMFGRPMEFWRAAMPKGMCLESAHYASNISDPDGRLSLRDFHEKNGRASALSSPISMETFAEYGSWFQGRAAPFLDLRLATRISPDSGGFRLFFEEGESLLARRVIVAAGIAPFARRPEVFAQLPAELACHASQTGDAARFAGRRVIVVGAGQSALETAALVHEAGAHVEVLVRQPLVRWRGGSPPAASGALNGDGFPSLSSLARRCARLGLIRPLLYSPLGIGPAGVSRIVGFPGLLRRLPRSAQDRCLAQCLQPSASWTLAARLRDVAISTSLEVVEARERGGAVSLRLNDGTERMVDHVLLATGYKTDLARYGFLSPDLLARIATHGGYPVLGPGLESTVPGLHFIGAPATYSYGALMHFVAGTPFTARHLAGYVAKGARVLAESSASSLRPATDWT